MGGGGQPSARVVRRRLSLARGRAHTPAALGAGGAAPEPEAGWPPLLRGAQRRQRDGSEAGRPMGLPRPRTPRRVLRSLYAEAGAEVERLRRGRERDDPHVPLRTARRHHPVAAGAPPAPPL